MRGRGAGGARGIFVEECVADGLVDVRDAHTRAGDDTVAEAADGREQTLLAPQRVTVNRVVVWCSHHTRRVCGKEGIETKEGGWRSGRWREANSDARARASVSREPRELGAFSVKSC